MLSNRSPLRLRSVKRATLFTRLIVSIFFLQSLVIGSLCHVQRLERDISVIQRLEARHLQMLKKVIFILYVVESISTQTDLLRVPLCLHVWLSRVFQLLIIGSLCYEQRTERDICSVQKLLASQIRQRLDSLVKIRQQIWTPLRRFGRPCQTFL